MINRILNNYYANGLTNTIYYYILNTYDLDIKTSKGEDYCLIFVKEKQKEKYNLIYKFKKENALIYISKIDDVIKEVKENIKDYLESESD